MKKIFACMMLVLSSIAFAGGNSNNNGPEFGGVSNTNITNDVRANALASVSSYNESKSTSLGVGIGGSSISQGGAASASSGGNSQSVSIHESEGVRYSGSYEVKNVPNVYSGDIHPTSPCMGSSSVGGAGVGFGFSFGSSWTDDECGIRETARSFSGMGLKEDALAVLCSSKYASVAPACKK